MESGGGTSWQGHAQIRPLPTLPEAGVAAYLRQRFGDGAWATGLAEMLYQRTQGHPFFFVTMIDAFVRQGYLVAHPAGWAFHGELDTVRLGVPDSVRQLIERQLEDAQPDEQAILVAASVAGAEFSAAAVAAALDQAMEPVEMCCATLARHGQFLQPRHRGMARRDRCWALWLPPCLVPRCALRAHTPKPAAAVAPPGRSPHGGCLWYADTRHRRGTGHAFYAGA